jgi:hypothetical protein
MSFCWFTSSIGYPNFLSGEELGLVFIKLADASLCRLPYKEAKALFPELDPASVETKKAAFQEYGLLYVVPGSNKITLTPLGLQVYEIVSVNSDDDATKRDRLIPILAQALSRYQFDNPMPVGGAKLLKRARSTDVLPYLATYYLLLRLDGLLTLSEIRGALFGLQSMDQLGLLETEIKRRRKSRARFFDIPDLPSKEKTADNLKIYFLAHLGINRELIHEVRSNLYFPDETAYELTPFGYKVLRPILDEQWPTWENPSPTIPLLKKYENIPDYFENGVGTRANFDSASDSDDLNLIISEPGGLLDIDTEPGTGIPDRKFIEGDKKLAKHLRFERFRNAGLVREAKKLFKEKRGRLFCELCNFDFEAVYGERGRDYIEAHHKVPISELDESREATVDDLAMLCSNCHRIVHRNPWITIEDLDVLLNKGLH